MKYFVKINEKEQGPIDSKQLKALAKKGHIKKGDFVRKETSQNWHKANEVKGLFDSSPKMETPKKPPKKLPKMETPKKPPKKLPKTETPKKPPKKPPKTEIKHFYTKIVGVTQGNRQFVVSKCQIGELLFLEHEEDNPVDPNAVKALRQTHEELGYLSAHIAKDVVKKLKQGYYVSPLVANITGGTSNKNFGCNIVLIFSKNADTATVQRYFDENIAPEFHERINASSSHESIVVSSSYLKQDDIGCLIPLLWFCLISLMLLILI